MTTPARPPARPPRRPRPSRAVALGAGLLLLVASLPGRRVAPRPPAGRPRRRPRRPALQPTVQYEEAMAHADDTTDVRRRATGSRSRSSRARRDRWAVGGVTPRALPAGRLSGKAMRAAADAAAARSAPRLADPVVAVGPADLPYLDPASAFVGPAGRRGRPGRPQARGLRLPAVLGADRQLDPARLGEALDGRLLRGRRRRPTATSRSATATARRRSAGAAGRARR